MVAAVIHGIASMAARATAATAVVVLALAEVHRRRTSYAKGFGIRHQAIALPHWEDDTFTFLLSTKTSCRQRYPRPPGSHQVYTKRMIPTGKD
jgi:hypothetical protein